MPKLNDLTGQTFGRWTVIERAADSKSGQRRWLCLCACGETVVVHGTSLKSGGTKGCLKCKGASSSLGSGVVFEARSALRLTQREFSELSGISEKSIRTAESEGRAFSLKGHGLECVFRFNKVVPQKFLIQRPTYQRLARGRMKEIGLFCHRCHKAVGRIVGDVKRYEHGFCNKSCASGFRHHGALPREVAPSNELSPSVIPQRELMPQRRERLDLMIGMRKTIERQRERQTETR